MEADFKSVVIDAISSELRNTPGVHAELPKIQSEAPMKGAAADVVLWGDGPGVPHILFELKNIRLHNFRGYPKEFGILTKMEEHEWTTAMRNAALEFLQFKTIDGIMDMAIKYNPVKSLRDLAAATDVKSKTVKPLRDHATDWKTEAVGRDRKLMARYPDKAALCPVVRTLSIIYLPTGLVVVHVVPSVPLDS